MNSVTNPQLIHGKRILITGGTGSLGKVLVRHLLSGSYGTPEKIVVFSRDEAKQHFMRMAYLNKKVTTDEVIYSNFKRIVEFRIGDVRNFKSIANALQDVDIVVNAAALKQVPSCEYFVEEAVLTNVMGPCNIVDAIRNFRLPIETVVAVSTDKACKPVNVMGMTKALQEKAIISANIHVDTRMVCVRYGNVLSSRGSVIPLFHEQISKGGPVTITTRDMTRFLLTLDDAVRTVMAALEYAKPGETIIPVAPSARITNLVDALIGDLDIETRVVGIRPGEKVHEILVSDEEAPRTARLGNYWAISSALPELAVDRPGDRLDRHFSSADHLLEPLALKNMLVANDLLVPQTTAEELLR